MSGHRLLTCFRRTLYAWGLGSRRNFCHLLCCFWAFLQVAELPSDPRISGITPGALVGIWISAVVHCQAAVNSTAIEVTKGEWNLQGHPSTLWILLQWSGWNISLRYQSESESCSVVSDSLQPHGLHSPRNSPGQNTGVVAFPFSRGSSQPNDQTQVSCTAGGFFTSWGTGDVRSTKGANYYSNITGTGGPQFLKTWVSCLTQVITFI